MAHFTRIMYIEKKDGINGSGRIGRVTFSKSGKSLYYQGKTFASLHGDGFLENYYDVESGDIPAIKRFAKMEKMCVLEL